MDIGREQRTHRRARQLGVFTAIVVLHAGLVLVVLRATPQPPDPVVRQVVTLLTVRAVTTPPQPLPLPATVEPEVATVAAPTFEVTPVAMPEPGTAADAAADAAGCALETVLTAALQRNARLTNALAGLGPRTRPPTGAVMAWNGAWVRGETAAETAILLRLQAAVLAAVATAPEACRAVPVVGPRFIVLGSGDGRTLLGIGSGVWRWDDLLTAAP